MSRLHLTLGERLGKGSYGKVYKCTNDEEKKDYAVKVVRNDKVTGLPHLMEMSIMSSIDHPHLQKACRVHVRKSKTYIVQELAVSDAADWCRKSKNAVAPELLRKWLYQLATAVACLHQQRIVHADIKGSNVLIFKDDTVRLCDFTLSVKQWSPGQQWDYRAGTATHRAPEMVMGRTWDYPADIWSLGCTFFEMAYGCLLFPHQKNKENKNDKCKRKYVSCFLDWAKRRPDGDECLSGVYVDLRGDPKYDKFHLPKGFDPKAPVNDLILKMLKVNPTTRIKIMDVLKHPYFTGFKKTECVLRKPKLSVPGGSEEGEVKKIVRSLIADKNRSITLAYNIYRACNELKMKQDVKARACAIIAGKMVLNYCPIEKMSSDERASALAAEKDICSYLAFRLHYDE